MIRVDNTPLTEAQARSHRLALRLLLPLLVLLLVIVVPLYAVYDVSKVDGHSMMPTLRSGDYLLITRGLETPMRGQVVVLHVTNPDGSISEIVKRVVALAGDQVSIRGDFVSVNGKPEQFNHLSLFRGADFPTGELVVPTDTVYALGDNRPVSSDSRFIGPLPAEAIHGRVVAVWFPVTRMRLIPSP